MNLPAHPLRAARLSALLFLIGLLSACGAGEMLSAASIRSGISVERDIAYGPLPRHRYDIYRSAEAGQDAPVIVFFYGGSWRSGDRSSYGFVGQALAAEGFTTVIADYRTYPDAVFPGFVEDGAKAAAHVRETVAAGRPLFLSGHSAGAQIAALLAYDDRHLRAEGLEPCAAIAGFVGIAGPYDFLPLDSRRLMDVFPEETRDESQPVNFTAGRKPASLLLHGLGDGTVSPRNAETLAERLASNGNIAETRFYDGVGHIGILGAISRPMERWAPTLSDMSAFVRERANEETSCAP